VSWVVIVPAKGRRAAKSRLGDHPDRQELSEAFALDTVAALLAASVVARVFVVTADAGLADRMVTLGAAIVPETPWPPEVDPLNSAIAQATNVARAAFPGANLAVVTGDLPALTVVDVEVALALAGSQDLSMIPDVEGTGTTAILALAGVPFTPRFGAGSRSAHEAAGHVPLTVPQAASIRRDVDTVLDLAEVMRLGVGPHTSALVARSRDVAANHRASTSDPASGLQSLARRRGAGASVADAFGAGASA
jgi:2-phospho-L-lactate guanylyltransferase